MAPISLPASLTMTCFLHSRNLRVHDMITRVAAVDLGIQLISPPSSNLSGSSSSGKTPLLSDTSGFCQPDLTWRCVLRSKAFINPTCETKQRFMILVWTQISRLSLFLYAALASYAVMTAIQASPAARERACWRARARACVRAGCVWHFSLSGGERAGCVIEMSCVQERSLTERQPLAMPRRACDR